MIMQWCLENPWKASMLVGLTIVTIYSLLMNAARAIALHVRIKRALRQPPTGDRSS